MPPEDLVEKMKAHCEHPTFLQAALGGLYDQMEKDPEKKVRVEVVGVEGIDPVLAALKNYPEEDVIQLNSCLCISEVCWVFCYLAFATKFLISFVPDC